MRIGVVKYQNSLLERKNVFHFTQTPELYLAFSKMYTLVTPPRTTRQKLELS